MKSIIHRNSLKFLVCGVIATLVALGLITTVKSFLPNRQENSNEIATKQHDRYNHITHTGNQTTLPKNSIRSSETASNHNITLEEAEKSLNDYNNIKDIRKRAYLCSNIIKQLCLAGLTDDARYLIESNVGEVRNSEISAYFYNAKLSDEVILEQMAHLEYSFDVRVAIGSYLRRLGPYNISASLDQIKNNKELNKLNNNIPFILSNNITLVLTNYMVEGENPQKEHAAIVNLAAEFLNQNQISPKDYIEVLKLDSSLDPFDNWNKLNLTTNETTKTSDVNSFLISKMVIANPEKAMSLLSENSDSSGVENLKKGMQRYLNSDISGAYNWFNTNQQYLSNTQSDAMINAFIDTAESYGELATAMEWANKLQDEKTKISILNRLQQTSK
ncbi:hypothetical protein JIN85_11815 [Luteolibacter pohnpeiensis]|uniref:Uncharacterized protein n=1 Tax=Luteolibacter pohnpeiensis TaxID=454153 RepID=A0A934SBG2_9BACT|nr:hypothetical protein [Luteolibacter pohnpeiensis]MBK1883107.1 hypothetical protein [Luteolibacter pohnpeiensis]